MKKIGADTKIKNKKMEWLRGKVEWISRGITKGSYLQSHLLLISENENWGQTLDMGERMSLEILSRAH